MPVPPRLPTAILRALLPLAERDEVLADLAAEYDERARRHGEPGARRWLWGQAIGSTPALLRRSWWRGWSGFEPRANAMRPGGNLMERWILDLRYSLRRLRTRPTYALLAVLTLALGVGGTAAIAGIVRALLVDPLPYRDEASLVQFYFDGSWNNQEVLHLRPQWKELGFTAVAAHVDEDVTLSVGGAPTRLLRGTASTWELFDVLGVRPVVGRAFQEGDDVPGAEPVAILSYGLWRELGGDPGLVGKRLRLDGVERTVIGVAPRGFWFPDPATRVWTPRSMNPQSRSGQLTLVGRLAPGREVAAMGPQLQRLTTILEERFDYDNPQWDKTKNPTITPLRESFVGPMRPALLATTAAMALILLIACANVGALMLGQVEGRASELAVRSALGADRGRLVAQLVSEALVIGLLAGAAGAGLATAGFRMLVGALPLGEWGERASLDWSLFGAAIVIALLASLAVALFPVLSLRRTDLRTTIGAARTSGVTGGGRVGLQSGLVVGEVALAVLLAAGAGLLVRSVSKLYAIDPGIDTEGIAILDVAMPADVRGPARIQTLVRLVDELGRIPGVKIASSSSKLPLRGNGNNTSITIPGQPDLAAATTYFRIGSIGYLETIGAKVKSGRTFNASDRPGPADTTQVDVVINEALATKYFPGVDPVGRYTGGGWGVPERVIGVVNDVAEGTLTEERKPVRYYLEEQLGFALEGQSLLLRTERPQDATRVFDQARAVIRRVAPGVAVQEVTTMESVFDKAVGPARQVMSLLSLLTALALVLGAVGVYGVVAHLVSRRLRDWSIRVALGLAPRHVVGQVVRHGAALAGVGVVLGVLGALLLARLLTSLLYGVGASDPVAMGIAGGALLLVAVLAALVPALRASRVDPAMVLREQ
ncbi:MAG: ADOP family duplicated permease [Gemmatimonadaceae bacterium]